MDYIVSDSLMDSLKLLATGDITLVTKNDIDPFGKIYTILKNKDILFGNLEVVLSNQGQISRKSFILKTSPDKVKYLIAAGFDILNVANNHIYDLGSQGLINTLDILDNNKIPYIGSGKKYNSKNFYIIDRKGIKLGFLGYTRGVFKTPKGTSINKLKKDVMLNDIKSIKSKCDIVIVSLHWGEENVFYPSPNQIKLAHELVDNGASLIIGHHTHVIQGVEKYKHGLIAYSLGNFQLDPRISQSKTNESFILSVDIDKNGINGYNIIPIIINDDTIPIIVDGEKKEKILHFVKSISKQITSDGINENWWFEQFALEYLSGNFNSYVIRIKKYGIPDLLECLAWLVFPFCIKCYMAIIRLKLKNLLNMNNRN